MVLFAPPATIFINVFNDGDHGVANNSYLDVAGSVGVFLGISLGAAFLTCFSMRTLLGPVFYQKHFLLWVGPVSLTGLSVTILVLIASKGHHVVSQIVSVFRVVAPLVVYFAIILFTTLVVTKRLGFGYKLSCKQSFTAASNNFGLAIAVPVATYGIDCDVALAATVGRLVQVPVSLTLVYVVKWYGTAFAVDAMEGYTLGTSSQLKSRFS